MIKKILSWSSNHPRQLFLIDGAGALLSALLLGLVLPLFQEYIGMPRQSLYLLAAIPCFFVLYDIFCYARLKTNFGPYLKGIAMANMLYGVLSLILVFFHYAQLTYLGLFYFLSEIVIVAFLAVLELRTASRLS